MSRWSCVNHPDNLCYICAKHTPWNQSNERLSVPIAQVVGMKETHESVELILKLINYSNHNWDICGDLKVVALLLSLQLGYTEHMSFLCLWNSCDDNNHYKVKQWSSRVEHTVCPYNVLHASLVDPLKV